MFLSLGKYTCQVPGWQILQSAQLSYVVLLLVPLLRTTVVCGKKKASVTFYYNIWQISQQPLEICKFQSKIRIPQAKLPLYASFQYFYCRLSESILTFLLQPQPLFKFREYILELFKGVHGHIKFGSVGKYYLFCINYLAYEKSCHNALGNPALKINSRHNQNAGNAGHSSGPMFCGQPVYIYQYKTPLWRNDCGIWTSAQGLHHRYIYAGTP